MKIIPVILCGGSGTRLWPLSRKSHPKQFLSLTSEKSLFQETLIRSSKVTDESPTIITGNDYRFLAAEQIAEVGLVAGNIILEPIQRNTAPAIAAAAIQAMKQSNSETPLLLILPADHNIKDTEAFEQAVQKAAAAAKNGKLVTFGITPDRPETGYGYIRAEQNKNTRTDRKVEEFVEKPNLDTAKKYVKSGNYYWNSGMFLFRADTYIEELTKFSPEMSQACEEAVQYGVNDLDFLRLDSRAFSSAPDDSIDYAVMEKSNNVVVVPMDAHWSDVGSWNSLSEIMDKDDNGNYSSGDTLLVKTKNSIVHSQKRLIATIGLDNITVIETPDAILVAKNSETQNVKAVVEHLKSNERSIATSHKLTYRPWGKYDSVDSGSRFQVKRITVKPGEVLSLQKHFHRSEHWIVVSGIAEVTRDDEVFMVPENESAYIPRGAIHRLSNPGKIPLELIEVQSGSYLGEDDIVRIEDNYGRNNITKIAS